MLHEHPLNSTSIDRVTYDDDKKVLTTYMVKGHVIQYSGVPFDVYQSLIKAQSSGKYYNQYIHSAGYPFRYL